METCFSCGIQLAEEDIYEVKGKAFCGDCAMGQHKYVKTCDPNAVSSAKLDLQKVLAKNNRKNSGQTGIEGLTDQQKNLYLFMKEHNGVTMEQFVKKFHLKPDEIRANFAVLRHLELGKAQKQEDGIYFVVWEA